MKVIIRNNHNNFHKIICSYAAKNFEKVKQLT